MHMHKRNVVRSALAAGALALCFSSAAVAQGVAEDVRCLIAAGVFVRSEKDPAKRQVAFAVRYFYLGRIDARAGEPSLRALLRSEPEALTGANVGPIMTACARSMQSKEAALRALGGPPAK